MKTLDDTQKILARFNDKNNANLFIVSKCDSDNTVGEKDLFFILQFNIVVGQLNKKIIAEKKIKSASDKGNEKKIKFKPTPLPTKLRLGPGNYWVDENDEDENKK